MQWRKFSKLILIGLVALLTVTRAIEAGKLNTLSNYALHLFRKSQVDDDEFSDVGARKPLKVDEFKLEHENALADDHIDRYAHEWWCKFNGWSWIPTCIRYCHRKNTPFSRKRCDHWNHRSDLPLYLCCRFYHRETKEWAIGKILVRLVSFQGPAGAHSFLNLGSISINPFLWLNFLPLESINKRFWMNKVNPPTLLFWSKKVAITISSIVQDEDIVLECSLN